MQDKANGTKRHGKGLPIPVVTAIKPIYVRLNDDTLLQKCPNCKTQMSLSTNWSGIVCLRPYLLAQMFCTCVSMMQYHVHFNIGASASIKTQEKMGISTVMVTTVY